MSRTVAALRAKPRERKIKRSLRREKIDVSRGESESKAATVKKVLIKKKERESLEEERRR